MPTTYHNAAVNISASLSASSQPYGITSTFLTVPTSSTYILKNCQIANASPLVGGSSYTVNVVANLHISSSATTHSLVYFGAVPAFSSLDVLSDNLVLEGGDSIVLTITGSNPISGSWTPTVNAIGSYLNIS